MVWRWPTVARSHSHEETLLIYSWASWWLWRWRSLPFVFLLVHRYGFVVGADRTVKYEFICRLCQRITMTNSKVPWLLMSLSPLMLRKLSLHKITIFYFYLDLWQSPKRQQLYFTADSHSNHSSPELLLSTLFPVVEVREVSCPKGSCNSNATSFSFIMLNKRKNNLK